jgi:hypothetical protein
MIAETVEARVRRTFARVAANTTTSRSVSPARLSERTPRAMPVRARRATVAASFVSLALFVGVAVWFAREAPHRLSVVRDPATSGTMQPPDSGIVTGFIEPCVGIPLPGSPAKPYAAGDVTALRGTEHLRSVDEGAEKAVYPTDVVDREHVGQNEAYRFVLSPGDYVLTVSYDGGGPSRLPVGRQIAVQAGVTVQVNLGGECK